MVPFDLSRWWKDVLLGISTVTFSAFAITAVWAMLPPDDALDPPHRPASLPRIDGDPVALLEELPLAPPSATTPTLVESGDEKIEARIKALARELGRMWTRDSEQLVRVIEEAVGSAESSPPDTLLLAIAHAETNGHILDVSEAGAVGLAQATPIAYLQEGFTGKLFITDDYMIGARAYIMKKPLGDADTIATILIEKRNSRERARKLLRAAKRLRRVGVSDLELLRPYADEAYFDEIEAADEHNAAVLRRLQRLIDAGSTAELKTFRDRVRDEYRAMKRLQVEAWSRYQRALVFERDYRLQQHYRMPASIIKSADAYEAGNWLGDALDERFSPNAMARFLVAHLDRKSDEARKIKSRGRRSVEELTAGLYNGGSHNVQRMLAGLITRLPETEKYMKKVPRTRNRLEIVAGSSPGNSVRTLR
jgi:hypothetical protein